MRTIVNKLFYIAFFCLLWVGTAPAHANVQATNNEDAALIRAVENFLYQQAIATADEVMIEVTPPSASFGPCTNPAPFFPSANQQPVGRVSVGVRCGESGAQVRYVQAHIAVIGSFIVVANDVASGTVLTANDLRIEHGDISRQQQGAFAAIEPLVGMLVRRNLRAGQTVHQQMVQVPHIISRGDNVVVEVAGAGFAIQREGTAMDAGGKNETIRVRIGNREVVSGRVTAPGKVVLIP